MESQYGLVVTFTLERGHEDAFDTLVNGLLPAVRAHEPGTLVYACHTVEGHPEQRVFYELYRDRAAFDAHERQAHVLRFLDERAQHIASFHVAFVHLIDAVGIQP